MDILGEEIEMIFFFLRIFFWIFFLLYLIVFVRCDINCIKRVHNFLTFQCCGYFQIITFDTSKKPILFSQIKTCSYSKKKNFFTAAYCMDFNKAEKRAADSKNDIAFGCCFVNIYKRQQKKIRKKKIINKQTNKQNK